MFNVLVHREELISTEIEETVSRMQVVIELGRYLRDKNVVPVKVGVATNTVHVHVFTSSSSSSSSHSQRLWLSIVIPSVTNNCCQ